MLNKNNFLENKRVVDFILDIIIMYKGRVTPNIDDQLFNILKEEKFISNKVKKVDIRMFEIFGQNKLRNGVNLYIYEYYHSHRFKNNYFGINKETIDGWLGHGTD